MNDLLEIQAWRLFHTGTIVGLLVLAAWTRSVCSQRATYSLWCESLSLHLQCCDAVKVWWYFSNEFITNFPQNVPVEKFWKSVNIWRRYGQKFPAYFCWPTRNVFRVVKVTLAITFGYSVFHQTLTLSED